MEKTNDKNHINQILFLTCAEINTGKDRFAAFENRYRIEAGWLYISFTVFRRGNSVSK